MTGLTSTSLSRAPAPAGSFVRGKSGYMPFLPGGLEDAIVDVGEDEAGVRRKGLCGGRCLRNLFIHY